MKEQLISFETAKLAKEKGFDWETMFVHESINVGGERLEWDTRVPRQFSTKNENNVFSASTQSLLQTWLRKVHDIDVYILPNGTRDKSVTKRLYHPMLWVRDEYQSELHSKYTYEEALEVGLQKALKLIGNE